MAVDRIKLKFEQLRAGDRTGLVLFLTVGFPDMIATEELVPALVEAGADAIELGVPFSDPMADGATIQASSFHSLRAGVSLQDCIDLVGRLRAKVPETPLILMGYYNPIFSYGLNPFVTEARKAGVDGVIVADLPIEEAQDLQLLCKPKGLHLIPLLAPTSTDKRIKRICDKASGFIYCVSVAGITGAREDIPPGMFQFLERVRRHTALPLAVGFGISTRQHVENVGKAAEAAIVGSGLINAISNSPRDQLVARAVEFVSSIVGLGYSHGGKEDDVRL